MRATSSPAPRKQRFALLALCVLLAALAAWARATNHRKVELAGYSHWVSTDPDTLHQLRRVERIFREGPPAAEFDAELSWPDGSALPAPPYYPLVVWSLLAPFAPADVEARRGWLEESACRLPALFGVLAVLVAALAAYERLGLAAATFTGTCVAVAPGAIHYACLGNGDYQSWSLLLGLAQLALLASALGGGWLERPKSAWVAGAALGALHGLAIGSWTPALIQLAIADVALGLAIVLHTRSGERAALPHFGVALHLAALAVLAPAIASSPWRASDPWQIVNLSWFHAAYLGLAAAVFAPLFVLRAPSPTRKHYAALVTGVFLALFSLLLLFDLGPTAALREAFSWARAENTFMAQVAESAPLVGAGAWSKLFLYVGYGALAAPLAAVALPWIAWRQRELEWAPWCVALVVFGVMAAAQMRFAELVVAPLALGLAAAVKHVTARWSKTRLVAWSAPPLALAAAFALHWTGVASTLKRAIEDPPFTDSLAKRSARRMADWLRANSAPGSAVMALWSNGHLLQWAAERPVVASNYGLYVGEQAFRDSFRFFAANDAAAAEALLERRDVRYVLVTSEFERHWGAVASVAEAPNSSEHFAQSMGARLLGWGPPLDFLRLVHVSPLPDPKRAPPGAAPPMPSGFVYERVRGAWLEARGAPGASLELAADLQVGAGRMRYTVSARADERGVARLRTPYSSEVVGDVRPSGPFQVRFAGRTQSVHVGEEAVRSGATLELP
jgi:asparagine N-glycosylation enzyme membrane subunit Stt3